MYPRNSGFHIKFTPHLQLKNPHLRNYCILLRFAATCTSYCCLPWSQQALGEGPYIPWLGFLCCTQSNRPLYQTASHTLVGSTGRRSSTPGSLSEGGGAGIGSTWVSACQSVSRLLPEIHI